MLKVARSLLLVFFLLVGCSLDVNNPNSPTVEQALTTKDGIISLAVGLQQFYATNALGSIILTTGVTSREIAINTTFYNLIELEEGGRNLANTNTNVGALWANLYKVIDMANKLIQNSPNVPMEAGTRSGVMALAHLFKAMALGYLAQCFENLPLDVNPEGKAEFKPRVEAFKEAVRNLEIALQLVSQTPPSNEFKTKVLGSGFDLVNTIKAYKARYNLLAGNYQQAINDANSVDLTAKSVFTYSSLSPNPIYWNVNNLKYYAPRDSFGIPFAEPGDKRIEFYLSPDSALSNPNKYPIDKLVGFFTSITSSIPAYLPGEMRLIKAEAYVRLGDLSSAVAEINAIRTKTPPQDPFGIGASLPPYSGPLTADALLLEIYKQRCSELFLTGMRFEDSRRFGRPGPPQSTVERNRNFYPYPQVERINNPNTPADPAY